MVMMVVAVDGSEVSVHRVASLETRGAGVKFRCRPGRSRTGQTRRDRERNSAWATDARRDAVGVGLPHSHPRIGSTRKHWCLLILSPMGRPRSLLAKTWHGCFPIHARIPYSWR